MCAFSVTKGGVKDCSSDVTITARRATSTEARTQDTVARYNSSTISYLDINRSVAAHVAVPARAAILARWWRAAVLDWLE